MKKMILVGLGIIMMLSMVACTKDNEGGSNTDATKVNDDTSVVETVEPKGYLFGYKEMDIEVNVLASDVIDELGEPKSYFESASCAFQGLDKIYSYSGFNINTYEVDGVDHILSIDLLDDSVSTKEGIEIGSSKDKVISAYGECSNGADNSYKYIKDGMELHIIFEDDTVTAIEYLYITD